MITRIRLSPAFTLHGNILEALTGVEPATKWFQRPLPVLTGPRAMFQVHTESNRSARVLSGVLPLHQQDTFILYIVEISVNVTPCIIFFEILQMACLTHSTISGFFQDYNFCFSKPLAYKPNPHASPSALTSCLSNSLIQPEIGVSKNRITNNFAI